MKYIPPGHAAKDEWGEKSSAQRGGAEQDRRCHRRAPRDARGHRELGERQAGCERRWQRTSRCSVLKPASPTPWSILRLMEVLQDILPLGVVPRS